jgi:acetolactate synthase-1/2/3 large subunit
MRANDGTRTGGQILIDQLEIHGVTHAFCVPGESYLAALDALHGSKIALTVCRHEGAASMMAEAVGKTTGRPGICFVTRGPGATNAAAGVHIARQDSSPMILFVGQVGRDMREREAFQELDYRAVFGTVAKWATEIDDATRIPEIVSRAFHTACNGRPGPVVIALPEDMLTDRAVTGNATAFEPVEIWPGLTDMSRLQKMLWAAKRPVALIGGSRWSEAASAAMMRFAERFQLPVATTFRRQYLFDAAHPCYAGDFGIAELHAFRHSRTADEAGACAPGLGRTRPRLSSDFGDQCLADRVLRGAGRVATAERNLLARRVRHRSRRFSELD